MEITSAGPAPAVSVIIPSYNTAPLITHCLHSVFAQTYGDFEVIVVNDGSPDTPQLEEALRPYRDRIVYVVQENKRAAGARNTAIRKARGAFLAFLDSDDSWLPGHLAAQMKQFEQDSALDLVYSNAVLTSNAPRQKTFMDACPSEGLPSFEALLTERCQIPISTVVARKTAILEAGLFDETLARCDDYDMWLRTAFFAAKCGRKFGYSRNVQARLYIGRPNSLGRSRSKMSEAYWKILETTAKNLPLNEDQHALVSKRAAEIRARYLLEEGKLQLRQQQPEKARELFAEANAQLRTIKLRLIIWSLYIAPQSASKLITAWNRHLPAGTA